MLRRRCAPSPLAGPCGGREHSLPPPWKRTQQRQEIARQVRPDMAVTRVVDFRRDLSRPTGSSCPGLIRASTPFFRFAKTWMAGIGPAMTMRKKCCPASKGPLRGGWQRDQTAIALPASGRGHSARGRSGSSKTHRILGGLRPLCVMRPSPSPRHAPRSSPSCSAAPPCAEATRPGWHEARRVRPIPVSP